MQIKPPSLTQTEPYSYFRLGMFALTMKKCLGFMQHVMTHYGEASTSVTDQHKRARDGKTRLLPGSSRSCPLLRFLYALGGLEQEENEVYVRTVI